MSWSFIHILRLKGPYSQSENSVVWRNIIEDEDNDECINLMTWLFEMQNKESLKHARIIHAKSVHSFVFKKNNDADEMISVENKKFDYTF